MVIQGELRSLKFKSNSKYFDTIHISSQLGKSATYENLGPFVADKEIRA